MEISDRSYSILIADDDEDDFTLIAEALKASGSENPVNWVRDGEELMDFLNSTYGSNNSDKKKPSIIILDLNLPKKDGREALKDIRSNPKLKHIPVVILTTSRANSDIQQVYELGANSFIQKPFKYADFSLTMENFFKYWICTVKLPS